MKFVIRIVGCYYCGSVKRLCATCECKMNLFSRIPVFLYYNDGIRVRFLQLRLVITISIFYLHKNISMIINLNYFYSITIRASAYNGY